MTIPHHREGEKLVSSPSNRVLQHMHTIWAYAYPHRCRLAWGNCGSRPGKTKGATMAPLAPSTWMRMSQPFFLLTSPACMRCCITGLCVMAVLHSPVYQGALACKRMQCVGWGEAANAPTILSARTTSSNWPLYVEPNITMRPMVFSSMYFRASSGFMTCVDIPSPSASSTCLSILSSRWVYVAGLEDAYQSC